MTDKCPAEAVIDFDSVDCRLESGHRGLHECQGDGPLIEWAAVHPQGDASPIASSFRAGSEWWLEGVQYREVLDSAGSVVAYADPDSAEFVVAGLNRMEALEQLAEQSVSGPQLESTPTTLDPQPWVFVSDQVFGVRSATDKGFHSVSDAYYAFQPRGEFNQDRSQYEAEM